MKVLHLSESDGGGAGRATLRLHRGLQRLGVDSQILVQLKYSDESSVFAPQTTLGKASAKLKLPERLDALPLKFYPQRHAADFSLQWLPESLISKVAKFASDVVNLHWVCHGYLSIESIAKFQKPIVWTLHDMWAFTGGCHYSQECDRYINSCGACPQLSSSKNADISRWVWQRKLKAWQDVNLTIVTPSTWLAKCARSSSLFKDVRVEVILNGLDTQHYKPIPQQVARSLLNLPQNKQLILFGAMYPNSDRRKGFHWLQQALKNIRKSEGHDSIEIAIFGAARPQESIELGLPSHYLGRLNDDISLAVVYSAADVFVAPSTQDNLPNTVMEALACGTPCVAFNIGGMPDMIEHQHNGYLAQAFDSEDLARGIIWVLEHQENHQSSYDSSVSLTVPQYLTNSLRHRARQKAEKEFNLELQARRYESLYLDKIKN